MSVSSSKFGTVALARRSFSSHLNSKLRCSLRHIHMDDKCRSGSRGALVVLEGLDRCGKTSQSTRLVKKLDELGYPAELFRFPDRNTVIGKMISSYLNSDSQLDDHTVHLLFSANRWEKRSLMESKLRSGITLIVDRYAYSGVAFSAAKGLDIEWCKAPDMGLLAPDLVLYLDISPEKASERGGYGGERYEQLEFQKKVADRVKSLSKGTSSFSKDTLSSSLNIRSSTTLPTVIFVIFVMFGSVLQNQVIKPTVKGVLDIIKACAKAKTDWFILHLPELSMLGSISNGVLPMDSCEVLLVLHYIFLLPLLQLLRNDDYIH